MSPLVLALVLASAVIHASWNLWTKQIGGSVKSGSLMWILTAISAVFYAPIALLAPGSMTWRPQPTDFILIAGSGVIHVGYFLLLLRGYRRGDLSLVYPVARGTGPLLGSALALVVFGEQPTTFTVVGALAIAVGILVLTWRPSGAGRAPGLGTGLAVGLMIATYILWDGWAVKRAGIPPLLFYWAGEVVRVVLFTPAALSDRAGVADLWRTHRARVLGIALLSPLSYILILIAFRLGAVSHIAPAREIAILIGAWLGGRVLGEGDRRRRLLAAACFAAGVVVLAL